MRLHALKARGCGRAEEAPAPIEAKAAGESNGNAVMGSDGTNADASVMPPVIMAAPDCE